VLHGSRTLQIIKNDKVFLNRNNYNALNT